MKRAKKLKCLECRGRPITHEDPRKPPLSTEKCLCKVCHRAAVIDELQDIWYTVEELIRSLSD